MLVEDTGHVTALRNDPEVPGAREFESRENQFSGDSAPSKLLGNLRGGEDHAIPFDPVAGEAGSPAERHLEAAFRFVVGHRPEWRFAFHRAKAAAFREELQEKVESARCLDRELFPNHREGPKAE